MLISFLIQSQQKHIDNLTARLEQQAVRIQKVSAHLGLSKSAPETDPNQSVELSRTCYGYLGLLRIVLTN
jgi:hypothetical protein